MVDDFHFSPNQQAVLNALQGHLQHYGEHDEAFEYVIKRMIKNSYFRNNVARYVPNLDALLEVTEAELRVLPHCGKKTVAFILDFQKKLKEHRNLLVRLQTAIQRERWQRDHKWKYREEINEYMHLRRINNEALRALTQSWDYYYGK